MMTSLNPQRNWSLSQRLIFRFFTIYFIQYFLISSTGLIPVPGADVLFSWIDVHFWKPLADMAGARIWHLHDMPYGPNGSGDTTRDYILVFVMAALSFLSTILWSVLDRKRKQYDTLLYWTMVLVRYMLAVSLISYGSVKIIKLQFPTPPLARLLEPYGQSSPMGLAWTFMGYSHGYNQFIGWGEFIAGFLLLFRRTKVLGSLFAIVVCMNVVAINFCFDVCVKLYSSHLLLMALFIAAYDVNALYRFFILHEPCVLLPRQRPFTLKRWQKNVLLGVKVAFVGWTLFATFKDAIDQDRLRGDNAPKPPLWGIYDAETFVLNKDTLAPLLTDTLRWRRMVVSYSGGLAVYSMNDKKERWETNIDTSKHILGMNNGERKIGLDYSTPDKDHLICKGYSDADSLYIVFKKENADSFLLMNRGFHWINEVPFNR